MSKQLQNTTRFNIPWDGPTEDGEQTVFRFIIPAGTDRRKVKRLMRKIFLALGERNYNRAIREMGWSRFV